MMSLRTSSMLSRSSRSALRLDWRVCSVQDRTMDSRNPTMTIAIRPRRKETEMEMVRFFSVCE